VPVDAACKHLKMNMLRRGRSSQAAVGWVTGRKCNILARVFPQNTCEFWGGLLARAQFISDNESLGLSGFPVVRVCWG
jgi:hypothetical protein